MFGVGTDGQNTWITAGVKQAEVKQLKNPDTAPRL